ncbi:hypothetical protein F909_03896 [Acinetobacter sp. ANC 3929]|uniref:hypothetical protein n=1 Tax=Acinetobacter sp. ANC 3929 TaxID=1217707 RepID=UPI0002CE5070|nr:hypothetical protein [Acinetobacter sp. ANC 3929]ENW78210.1 hypothetical protein F909_03896 [Acinetobacter sp. ANC 3929]
MTCEFDKWHYSDFCKVNDCEDSAQIRNLYESIFSIDENDAEKEAQHRAWNHRQSEVDELQKRVDAVMKIVSTKRQKCWSTSIEAANVLYELEQELEQALKGGAE